MGNKKFFAAVSLMLMLFFTVIAVSGCGGGGGGGSSQNTDSGSGSENRGEESAPATDNEDNTSPTDEGTPTDDESPAVPEEPAPTTPVDPAPTETPTTPNSTMGLRSLNSSNENFRVSFAENGGVQNIEGQFTEKTITSEGEAQAVLGEMGTLLGTEGTGTTLAASSTTSNEYGTEYQFEQRDADGTVYYGRGVTVSVGSDGVTDSLSSNLYTGNPVSTSSVRSAAAMSIEQAEEKAVEYYKNDVVFTIYTPEGEAQTAKAIAATVELDPGIPSGKVIYSFGEYENNPVLAYTVNVNGFREFTTKEQEEFADDDNNDEGIYFSEEVIIDSQSGRMIMTSSNVHGDQDIAVTARDESGDVREFTVDLSNGRYYMQRPSEYNLRILDHTSYNVVNKTSQTGPWDEQEVSLYTNALEVLDWYKATFGRNSVDGKGGATKPVQIVSHAPGWPNNAAWKIGENRIYFGNKSGSATIYAHSMAVDVDWITHEINHGMLEASIGVDFPWTGVTAAINQGYADLFGCLKVRRWLHGVNWLNQSGPYTSGRNIANPTDPKAYNRVSSGPITINNANVRAYVQIWGVLVSHAAYLMQQNGMSWEDLEQLWYKSMSMGYNASSTMQTVRTCVMKAGRKLGFSEDKLQIIRDAFDEEEIFDNKAALYGKVTDYTGNTPINGATVTATRGSKTYSGTTDTDGDYTLTLDLGSYPVTVSATGYVPFTATKRLSEASKDVMLNAALVRTGTGTISGDIINAESNDRTTGGIPGVTLEVRKGWDTEEGTVLQTVKTDANGHYTLTIDAGYYTITKSKAGYLTSTFNVTVAPSGNRQQNSYMTRTDVFVDNGQRIVLSWGANPADLDAHLVGSLSDRSNIHVFYAGREGKNAAGATVATLDVDNRDGNGHETITLKSFDPQGTYDFIVRWRGGEGSWAESNAVVELYADGDRFEFRPEARTEHVVVSRYGSVESVDGVANPSEGYTTYWHVFSIDQGRLIETGTLHKHGATEIGAIGDASIGD